MTTRSWHALGALALLLAALGLAWIGQPDAWQRWHYLAARLEPRLTERQVYIEPAELLDLMYNDYLDLHLIDVRSERDWNLFHLWGAQHTPARDLPAIRARLANLPQNGVIVLMSNDERHATEAWKLVMATASQPNAYILAGGINRWLGEFGGSGQRAPRTTPAVDDETLRHTLTWALGSRHPAALPDPHQVGARGFTKKVRLQKRVVRKGGCG